jgi:hypothetical protein
MRFSVYFFVVFLLLGFLPALVILFIFPNSDVGLYCFGYIVCASLLVWFLSNFLDAPKSVVCCFADKVKADLSIPFVRTYDVRFHRCFDWVGGFVYPLFPLVTVTNKNRQDISREAIIHENMHIHLLIYDGWMFFLLVGSVTAFFVASFIPDSVFWFVKPFVSSFVVALILTFFEQRTFERTFAYAQRNWVEGVRSWSVDLRNSYLGVYTLWIFFVRVLVMFLAK